MCDFILKMVGRLVVDDLHNKHNQIIKYLVFQEDSIRRDQNVYAKQRKRRRRWSTRAEKNSFLKFLVQLCFSSFFLRSTEAVSKSARIEIWNFSHNQLGTFTFGARWKSVNSEAGSLWRLCVSRFSSHRIRYSNKFFLSSLHPMLTLGAFVEKLILKRCRQLILEK